MAEIEVVLNGDTTLDKSWIKSIDSLSQSTGQPKNIYYGVTPSSGTIEILDRDGSIKSGLEYGEFDGNNISVDIYANGKKVQSHTSTDSSYSIYDKTLKINLSNQLDQLADKQYLGMKLKSQTQNAKSMLSTILSGLGYSASDIETILGQSIVVSSYVGGSQSNSATTVGNYLSNITIEHSYIEADTIIATLEKFCKLAQLDVYLDDNGVLPIFVSSRPLIDISQKIIQVPKKYVIGRVNQDLITKNKISTADTMYQEVNYNFVSIGSREIESYKIPANYPNTYSSYANILSDSSYNPNITVLYNNIQDYISHSTPSTATHFFYGIVKYTITQDVNVEIPDFKGHDRITYFFPNGSSTELSTMEETINPDEIGLYTSASSDADVIQYWLYDGYISPGLSNCELKVRINDDGTIDVFQLFLQVILNSSHTTVLAFYGTHTLSLDFKQISHTEVKQLANAQIDISSSELMQKNTKYGTENMYDIVSQNIISDYKRGVKTSQATVICANYYYDDGTQAKNWANGDILKVGDLVEFDHDSIIWKVTGRRFKYIGVPKIDLELQQVVNETFYMFNYTAIDANGNYEGTAEYDGTPVAYMLGTLPQGTATNPPINNILDGDYLGVDVTIYYNSTSSIPDVGISNLVIPETYKGLPITEISTNGLRAINPSTSAENKYSISYNVNTIKLGSNIKVLKDGAIRITGQDENSFTFNDGLERLEYDSLYGTFTSSAKITLPSSVNYIDGYVFHSAGTGSNKLSTITIQGSFTSASDTSGAYMIGDSANYVIFTTGVTSIIGRIANNSGDKLVFQHGINDNITLDITAPKSAITMDIYADNTIVRNYDWASKNITVTFHALSEYTES